MMIVPSIVAIFHSSLFVVVIWCTWRIFMEAGAGFLFYLCIWCIFLSGCSIASDRLQSPSEKANILNIIDENLTHFLPVPSEIMPADRFKKVVGAEGKEAIAYRGRESLRSLVDKVLLLLNGELDFYKTIRYIGNVGSGKSHNLAALTHYLRELKADPGQKFDRSVIYISSCELLFKPSSVENLKIVVCEAFPNDREAINACAEWKDLVKYLRAKPKRSILFIYDDWNYVMSENKLGDVGTADRNAYRQLLLELSSTIEAISSGSENLTTASKAESEPADTTFLYMFGGLTQEEWIAWKSTTGSVFAGLSDEDDKMVANFTGLVPLYLRTLEQFNEGDLRERVNNFASATLGQKTRSNIFATTTKFLTAPEHERSIFLHQMVNALSELAAPFIDHRFYDHRYFYYDRGPKVLRPVSGFVRQIMRDILDAELTDQFRDRMTLSWLLSAFAHGNPSVQGFAFEEYCLLQILRCPSQYIDGIPEGTPCKLERFDEEFPEEGVLNKEGLTLYWPRKFNLAYVDAILRYVHPQATIKSPSKAAVKIMLKAAGATVLENVKEDSLLNNPDPEIEVPIGTMTRQKNTKEGKDPAVEVSDADPEIEVLTAESKFEIPESNYPLFTKPQPEKIIDIIGVQVTIQEPRYHDKSLKFFVDCKEPKYCNFAKFLTSQEQGETVKVTKKLAWIVSRSKNPPSGEYLPSSECTQFVAEVDV